MRNKSLARDYIERAEKRLLALATLFEAEAWADVVRESQETVELALKALLRTCHVEVPRIHDVSPILEAEKGALPKAIRDDLKRYQEISKSLRRDRELAYYGSEDLTPSDFYSRDDAEIALDSARWVVAGVKPHVA